MKLRITASPLLLLAALFIGCGGHGHMRQLERLEAQLDTAPDAVRLALDSIPFASLGDEERALYAILRTQADYKCYVPLTTDTLIRYATDYYNRNRKSYRAAMAWYSLGCVYTEQNDDAAAIGAYLRAQTLFPDTTVRYHALCYQNLGRHYLECQLYDEAIIAFEHCKRNNLKDSTSIGYCDYHIGTAFLYQLEYDHAHEAFTKAWMNPHLHTAFKNDIPFQLAKIGFYGNRLDSETVLRYLDWDAANNPQKTLGANYSVRADIYSSMHAFDSALYYYQLSLTCQDEIHTICDNYKHLARLFTLIGENEKASEYIHLHTLMLDSICRISQTTEVQRVLALHESLLHKNRHYTSLRLVISLCAAIVIVALVVIIYNMGRSKRGISHSPFDSHSMTNNILVADNSYKQRLNDCTREFMSSKGSELVKKAKSETCPRMTKEECLVIKENIFSSFSQVVQDIYNQLPYIKEEDVHYCIYFYLRLPYSIIAQLANVSESSVRSRKSRLKSKLPETVRNLFLPN